MDPHRLTVILRKLASNSDNQTIFSKAKDYGFELFENKRDFTPIQMEYLSFLTFYNNFFMDIAMGEIDEDIIGDYIYEDSYMLYKIKSKGKNKKQKPYNYDNDMGNKMKKHPMSRQREKVRTAKTSQWIFKKPKRG